MALSERTTRIIKTALADPKAAAELILLLNELAPPTALTVNIAPAQSGAVSVGSDSRAFSSVFLRDRITGQVWRLEVEDGVFQVETA
jgi:hypothetical protein